MNVSVVIPSCEGRDELLVETVASVQAQTVPPAEILIVFNGEDGSVPAALEGKVRWVNAWNRMGASQARNLGAYLSTSDYVAFCDDDDLWATDYLERVLAMAGESGADILMGRVDQLERGKISPFKNIATCLTMDELLVRNPGVVGSCITVRRSAFLEVGGFDPLLSAAEDRALLMEFLLRNKIAKAVPEAQAILRVHEGPRLSGSTVAVMGRRNFIAKYRHLMSLGQFATLYSSDLRKAYRAKVGSPFGNLLGIAWYRAVALLCKALPGLG